MQPGRWRSARASCPRRRAERQDVAALVLVIAALGRAADQPTATCLTREENASVALAVAAAGSQRLDPIVSFSADRPRHCGRRIVGGPLWAADANCLLRVR